MQLGSVAGETHAARTRSGGGTTAAPRVEAVPGSTSSTSAAGAAADPSRPGTRRPSRRAPVSCRGPSPSRAPRASPTWPGTLWAGRLQPFPSRALRGRLLAAASVWPRRTRRGEGGSRRGSAAPGRRPRGGRSGRRRPKLAAQAGRCDSASPPPAAARGGVGEARPPGGRVLQGRGGCRRRGIPARGSPDPAGSPPHSLWRSGLWGARSRTGPRGAGRTSVPGPRRTASWRGGCGTFPTDVGDTNFQVLLPNWGNCANSPNTDRVSQLRCLGPDTSSPQSR